MISSLATTLIKEGTCVSATQQITYDGQSEEGSNVLKTFNTDPPGIANANDPLLAMASFAADSTILCTADVTSSSVGKMCTFLAGAASNLVVINDDIVIVLG